MPEEPPEELSGSADDDAEPKFDASDEIQWLQAELAAKEQELSEKDREKAQALADKDREKAQALADKDWEKVQALAEKDRELAELRARLLSGGSLPQPTCKTILIDMDNTICDFDGEVVRRFTDKFPGQTMLSTSAATRKNWGIAEDVREPYSEEVKKIFRESGFTESLPPIAGAARALKEMLAEGYDVRLCTSPLVNQPMGVGEKFVWVAAVLGDEWKKRIIITSDKTMVKGLMLIDDKLAIVDEKSVCNPPEWKQYAACRLTRHHPFARKPTPFTLLFESPPHSLSFSNLTTFCGDAESSFEGRTSITTRTSSRTRPCSTAGRIGARSSILARRPRCNLRMAPRSLERMRRSPRGSTPWTRRGRQVWSRPAGSRSALWTAPAVSSLPIAPATHRASSTCYFVSSGR